MITRPYASASEEHEESVEEAPNIEATIVAETATYSRRKTIAASKWSRVDTPNRISHRNPKRWSSIRMTLSSYS